MPRRVLSVTAPSRLHFGLFAFGGGHDLQFGGVGLMIDRPRTRLRFAQSERLDLQVSDSSRVRGTVATWLDLHAAKLDERATDVDQLPVAIHQVSSPEPHVGLGSGTQLTLSVAAGLSRWFQISPEMSFADAAQYGRARRSAVGSHGFFMGGLIVDQGKSNAESMGTLDTRIELPDEWRIVLVCPRGLHGPSGNIEDQLFKSLPAVQLSETRFLRQLVRDQMIPSANAGDFVTFSQSLYEFGFRAGTCYGTIQDGPFRGPQVRQLVDFVRSLGVPGVGQSSWGPCVFALCRSSDEATALSAELLKRFPTDRFWFETTSINQRGYSVSECCEQAITMEEPLRPI